MKIKALKACQMRDTGQTLVRVETDAGVIGYGEAGGPGPMTRGFLKYYEDLLIGKDPRQGGQAGLLVILAEHEQHEPEVRDLPHEEEERHLEDGGITEQAPKQDHQKDVRVTHREVVVQAVQGSMARDPRSEQAQRQTKSDRRDPTGIERGQLDVLERDDDERTEREHGPRRLILRRLGRRDRVVVAHRIDHQQRQQQRAH